MSRWKSSKRYKGVWSYVKMNKDVTYFIRYSNKEGNYTQKRVGLKSRGITEVYCDKLRNDILNKIENGEDDPFNKEKMPLFHTIALEYFEYLVLEDRSSNSIKITKQRYLRHIYSYIKDRKIDEISVKLMNEIKIEKKKILSNKTVNHILEIIGIIINYAIKFLDYKLKNHLSDGKVKRFKIDNNRERFLSKEEVKVLLENTKCNENVDTATRLGLSTGARLQTLLNIQKKNIDAKNRTVVLKDLKNNSTYTGFLPECYIPNFDFIDGLKPNDFVIGKGIVALNKTTIQHPFKKIADKLFNLGLDSQDRRNRLVFHSLRHTYCSLLASNNISIFTIQKLVNHKDLKSTMRYAKIDSKILSTAVESSFSE